VPVDPVTYAYILVRGPGKTTYRKSSCPRRDSDSDFERTFQRREDRRITWNMVYWLAIVQCTVGIFDALHFTSSTLVRVVGIESIIW